MTKLFVDIPVVFVFGFVLLACLLFWAGIPAVAGIPTFTGVYSVAGIPTLAVVPNIVVATSVFGVPTVNCGLSHKFLPDVAGVLVVAAWQPCGCRLLYFYEHLCCSWHHYFYKHLCCCWLHYYCRHPGIPRFSDVFGISSIVDIPPAPKVSVVVMHLLFTAVFSINAVVGFPVAGIPVAASFVLKNKHIKLLGYWASI